MTVFYTRSELTTIKRASYQISLIIVIWGFAYMLQKLLNLPIASGVLGFFILLILLQMQWLNLEKVSLGADILLGELLLFFIPPVVGVIQYQQLLLISGWKIFLVILLSTALVMASSVLVVKLFLQQDDVE
ncbi:CidA/LrgA family protein [Acinetobacter guillouiae]|uniref:CidA/LrgA family protein n=1 Tax=Acinetobacter guillouiae TaxID=106649 RepID=UPI0032B33430